MEKISPIMIGDTEFFSSGGHHFHNLEPLNDGTIGDVSPASYDKLITSDMLVASRQARYAGAISARAIHKLSSLAI